ncbi:hypothetical protein N7535_003048 [Penicillium sp. DV-2018c]|nr:hypothetical protein N7461_001261 [Penicillium sp. DV-2018c]KAJ5576122.1 hypothetical protein N7535_003048 [Penicillium sp. DV-2018c]
MAGSTIVNEAETRLFINNEFRPASDSGTFELKSPLTRETVARVPEATVQDTNSAVAAAKAAFPAWSALSPHDRGDYLRKLAELLLEAENELAHLDAISMGRPVSGYVDAKISARKLQYYASAGWDNHGETSLLSPGFVNMTFKQPFGVVAAIIPWNAPVMFLVDKMAPALAAGNTIVIKSSEKAPLTCVKVAQLIQEIGFPPGVVNILSGHGHISGSTLSHHMDVRMITFTGSARAGRLIQQAAAKSNMKNVLFELGGKSPAVIFGDADLERAAKETAKSIQWNSGQVCMATSRIYVHSSIADHFISLFKANLQAITPGDPTDPNVDHGPQADELQFNAIKRLIELGKKDGKLLLGGDSIADYEGYYVQPTIFIETPENAQIMKEEVFGPVVNVNVFESEEDVVGKVNDTEYGLYASVYTRDLDRALRFAKSMEAGSVGINCTSPTGGFDMPFGGWKGSGIGREGIHYSMNQYLETKTVLMKIGDA